jgi:benzil reductase ((S)-benzoin forming)
MTRLIILTGHTSGLGAALLDIFEADPTNRVVAIGRRRVPHPRPEVREVIVDLRSPADATHALDEALEGHDWAHLSQVALVNNAGVLPPIAPIGTRDTAALVDAVGLNLATPIALTNELLRRTADVPVERRIAQVSSGAASTPYSGWATYCATKAGLDHFTRCVALEAPPRCRIASIAPGVIDTAMQAQIRASSPADFPQHSRFVGLARDGLLASPAHAAERIVRYLFSDSFGESPVVDLRTLDG